MQAIPTSITSEILIVKMLCLSKYLLSDIRFETVDSKLAQYYFVCYVYLLRKHTVYYTFLSFRLWSKHNFSEEGSISVTRI
jgi:hypothetical protein